jgi:hypothetical protein
MNSQKMLNEILRNQVKDIEEIRKKMNIIDINTIGDYGKTPMMYILKNNNILNFNREKLLNFLKDVDFMHHDNYGNTVFLEVLKNYEKLSLIKIDLLFFIDNYEINYEQQDEEGNNIVMYVLKHNQNKYFNFDRNEIKTIMKKTRNLNVRNHSNENCLIIAAENNKLENLDLISFDILQICNKIDLLYYHKLNGLKEKAIYWILKNNEKEKLNIKKSDILELIKKSNIQENDNNVIKRLLNI